MDIKGNFGKLSGGNEEQVIRNWRQGSPCYKGAKNLAGLCCSVLWKAELVSDEIRYLVEQISKQTVEGVVFLLTAYSKIQEERDKLKELLSKKKPEPEYWKVLSLSIIAKYKEQQKMNNKGVVEQPFDKEITCASGTLSTISVQLGTEMGLYQWRH